MLFRTEVSVPVIPTEKYEFIICCYNQVVFIISLFNFQGTRNSQTAKFERDRRYILLLVNKASITFWSSFDSAPSGYFANNPTLYHYLKVYHSQKQVEKCPDEHVTPVLDSEVLKIEQPMEIQNLSHFRRGLERVRLLCELVKKREKLKQQMVSS